MKWIECAEIIQDMMIMIKDDDEDGNDCVFSVSTSRQTMRPAADTATWRTRPISLMMRKA